MQRRLSWLMGCAVLAVCIPFVFETGVSDAADKAPAPKVEAPKGPRAIIKTKFGEIELKLFPDLAPKHVENFIKLAKDGFYNGTIFHRVIVSLRTAAVIAGVGLLLMAILAPIAYLNTFQSLVKFDDAALTAQNILNSVGAFRTAIVLLFVVSLLDIIVAWAMYIVFLPADKKLSALTAWLRVIYGVIFAFAIVQLYLALNVLSADGTQAMSYLKAFQSIWDKALILFGFHLLLLGYLAFKSGYVPKWLAAFRLLAAIGYIVDGFGKMLSPAHNLSISQFTFVGEVLLIFWLFWKGVKGFDQASGLITKR